MADKLDLYHHGSSVCAAKVRFYLAEKALPWQGHYIDILAGEQFDPEYMKLNPKAVVPTVVHNRNVIRESTNICEYLDDVFPENQLRPADPVIRAEVRYWTKAVDEELHPACGALTFMASHRHTIGRPGPAGRAGRPGVLTLNPGEIHQIICLCIFWSTYDKTHIFLDTLGSTYVMC